MIERYTLPEIGSIWEDNTRFEIWLKFQVLTVQAWSNLNMIPKKSAENIAKKAAFNINRIKQIEEETHHDVIAFLTCVSENIGGDGKYLHYGLTSSDMIDTALSLQMKQSIELIINETRALADILKNMSIAHKETLMVGRTHGVHAEPITFGHKLAVWYFELLRNLKRLNDCKEIISVGKISGAVGSYATIDPYVEEYVCKNLGLAPASAATQIIQRDRHAECLSVFAITGSTLEKIALEVRGLMRTEVGEVEEFFSKKQKGSSAMPHKKNPIISERICGLARILRANALVGLENNALWHERDISHSSAERIILPDSSIALYYMLRKTNELLKNLVINKKQMESNLLKTGLVFSQKVLLKLIDSGMSREEAYRLVQKCAMDSRAGKGSFQDLLFNDTRVSALLNKKDLDKIFNADDVIKSSKIIIERVGESSIE